MPVKRQSPPDGQDEMGVGPQAAVGHAAAEWRTSLP